MCLQSKNIHESVAFEESGPFVLANPVASRFVTPVMLHFWIAAKRGHFFQVQNSYANSQLRFGLWPLLLAPQQPKTCARRSLMVLAAVQLLQSPGLAPTAFKKI